MATLHVRNVPEKLYKRIQKIVRYRPTFRVKFLGIKISNLRPIVYDIIGE